ncbi:hypothetical protein K7432_016995, partial [Basidiobolus ranarum]
MSKSTNSPIHAQDVDLNLASKEPRETKNASVSLSTNGKASDSVRSLKGDPATQTTVIPTEFTKRKDWPQKIICELTDIYYVIANSGKFIYCSVSCQELTGYSPAELTGRSLCDFIHVDDNDSFIRDLSFGATKKSFSLLYRFRKKDDRFIVLQVQCRPYFVDGSLSCFFCNARRYSSKAASMLDTLLEMKNENELLKRRLKK